MTQGGGIGRFTRKKATEQSGAKTAPVPPVATTNDNQQTPAAPHDEFSTYDSSAMDRADTFDNVGMFGGSFDVNFESTSFGFDMSSFESIGATGDLDESQLPPTTESTAAPDASAEQNPCPTTAPRPESSTGISNQNETSFGLSFSSIGNKNQPPPSIQETVFRAQAPLTPLVRPNTAAPQPLAGKKTGELSVFSRKRTAADQEVPATPMYVSASPVAVAGTMNGQPTGAHGAGAAAVATMKSDVTTMFQRIMPPPPPRVLPTKPLPTQQGNVIAPKTPKAASNNNAIYLPQFSGVSGPLMTPSPRPTATDDVPAGTKTFPADANVMLITPESAIATQIIGEQPVNTGDGFERKDNDSPTTVTHNDSPGVEVNTDFQSDANHDDFDELLSHFLTDLRNGIDLHEKGDDEFLDLEVDLSQAFALTLGHRSEAMGLLDSIEKATADADEITTEMLQF